MNKNQLLAKKVVSNVNDFDMTNFFEPKPLLDEMEDAATGDMEEMPAETLRGRNYGTPPLMLRPDYSGNFLDKLKEPFEGKAIESADNNNTMDFSMPSEMLKHQEKPVPRILLDDYYEVSRPGKPDEGGGGETLKDYWDRSWDTDKEAPEISEDLLDKTQYKTDEPIEDQDLPDDEFKLPAKRVAVSFLRVFAHMANKEAQVVRTLHHGPCVNSVVAAYIFDQFPIDLRWDPRGPRFAKMLNELTQSQIYTKTKGWRRPDVSGVTVRLQRAEPRVGRWTFTTGSGKENYTTIFQFVPQGTIKQTDKLQVRVSCSCPSWLFWGAQYNAVLGDYLYGKVRPKFTPPHKRDPENRFLVCKHVLACIPLVSRYRLMEITGPIRERLRRQPKIQIDKNAPKEKMRIPSDLANFGRQPEIQKVVREWPRMNPHAQEKFIMGLTSPGAVAFMAHRYPDTATEYVVQKLKDMAKTEKQASIREWAKRLLRYWA